MTSPSTHRYNRPAIFKNAGNKFFLGVRLELWICLLIVGGLLAVYVQIAQFDFIHLDDTLYVTENRFVRKGLTAESIAWAFTFKKGAYTASWHPLTWISHMIDFQLFGMRPGGHHISSLFLHIFSSIVLFGVLNRLSGALWRSAFVAALFAVHPLNIESVVWVAERKNVLSTFFWMLTLLSYVHYLSRPTVARYMLTFLVFMLGLMAKPMLVTLPFVLLLLDYWPLSRLPVMSRREWIGMDPPGKIFLDRVREKIPFFILTAVAATVTFFIQYKGGAVGSLTKYSLTVRVTNALISYVRYIGKMIWPVHLAIFYPHPGMWPWWQVGGAFLILAGISLLVIRNLVAKPYLVVGWLWYLGVLVPVIGLIQVGSQAMADRYAYVPMVGLFIMIVWGVPDALPQWRYKQAGLVVVSVITLALLTAFSRAQVRYWQNSLSLFQRALTIAERSPLVHNNLGVVLENKGKVKEAIRHYRATLQIDPDYVEAHINLGNALFKLGHDAEAIRHYRQALRINPHVAKAQYNLGTILFRQGRLKAAASRFKAALKIDPLYAEAYNNLGSVLVRQGRTAEAVGHFREALRIRPDYGEARNNLDAVLSALENEHRAALKMENMLRKNPKAFRLQVNLGRLYQRIGELDRALAHYQTALSIEPDLIEALNQTGIIYALKGRYQRARTFFRASIVKQPDRPEAYYFMAGSYARQSRTEEAIEWLRRAISRGFNNWDLIKTDRNLDNIRSTAYYQDLIKNR